MTGDLFAAEEAMEAANKPRRNESAHEFAIRRNDAQERLYKAQRKELEDSLRRRAKLNKDKP